MTIIVTSPWINAAQTGACRGARRLLCLESRDFDGCNSDRIGLVE